MPDVSITGSELVRYVLWMLTCIVGYLLTRSLNKIDATILIIFEKIKELGDGQQAQEIKLTEQVTTCEVCRLSCPQRVKKK